ncbi:zinc finger protein Noc-like [Gigantopelta aegis]|uniref:zinc finger protein Noc-like n=1 Tax=Gigantopelta aegis TaxID=1735272 RepID=UPI001B88B874|nr:zinc finger protein Noc-like [Gigantopelta aegis]
MLPNMTMLTTNGSQYLHPDYLQPLPTTLDAKKSPLALLAQTCSSIGKDTTPAKPIIPPLEKKEREKTPDKPGSNDNGKRPSSIVKKETGRESRSGSRTVPSMPAKDIPPLVPITNSSCENNDVKQSSDNFKPNSSSSPVNNDSSQRPISANSFHSVGKSLKESDYHGSPTESRSVSPHPKNNIHQHPSFSFGGLRTPSVLGHSSLMGGLPPSAHLGYPHLSLVNPYDIPVSASGYPAHLAAQANFSAAAAAAAAAAAQNSAVLKANFAANSAAGLSPYIAYTRVRTPSGATTLVPVCKDPYCSNCQLTLQNAHVSASCALPGCAQCAHEKSLVSLTTGLGYPGSSLSLLSPFSVAGAYPGAAAAAAASSVLPSLYHPSAMAPFICNWVCGSDYCGKRFTTSEELLHHLKSHTSSMDALPANLATSYGFGLPPHLSVTHGLYPHAAPPQLSPNSLRRSYPTSLSPVSSLLAASRFHPYKAPLSGGPAAGTQPYQSMPSYYSPYGLYGQRIGAAAVP